MLHMREAHLPGQTNVEPTDMSSDCMLLLVGAV
jgi:hypothetical protein